MLGESSPRWRCVNGTLPSAKIFALRLIRESALASSGKVVGTTSHQVPSKPEVLCCFSESSCSLFQHLNTCKPAFFFFSQAE